MGKVHDQIKAVLGAWGKWTTGCPCNCEHCVELDKKLADLTNVWSVIQKPIPGPIPLRPTLPKRQRPPVVVREVLRAWDVWDVCTVITKQDCKFCPDLHFELIALNQLIEAGPEEEKG